MIGFHVGISTLLLALATPAAPARDIPCESPPNQFYETKLGLSGPIRRIRGTITVRTLHEGSTATIGGIMLRAPGKEDTSVRLALGGSTQHSLSEVIARLTIHRNGKREDHEFGMFPVGRPVAFELALDAAGYGTAVIAGRSQAFDLKAPGPLSITVGCSTGIFMIGGLELLET